MSDTGKVSVRDSTGRQSISYGRYYLSVAFLLIGTVVFTYAATRTWTTRHVLTKAGDQVSMFLESKKLYPGVSNREVDIDEITQLESKRLLGDIWDAGGRYFWWNDAIPYWGIGAILVSLGAVIPFYQSSKHRLR